MKKLIPLLFILAAVNSQAQFVCQSMKNLELLNFLSSKTTYVLQTGNDEIDSLMNDALSKYWKVTPYKMVPQGKIYQKAMERYTSILVPTNFNVGIDMVRSSDGRTTASVSRSNMGLSVFAGGDTNYYAAEQVAFVCLDQKYNSKDWYDDLTLGQALYAARYRYKDMIATLSRSLQIVKDGDGGKVEGGRIKMSSDGWHFGSSTVSQVCPTCANSIKVMSEEVYNKELPRLKTKTLYLLKENFRDTRDLAKVYPYKFKVVDRKEYEKAISEERSGIAYLMLTHSYWGGITVIDPSTHECIGAIHIDKCTTIDAGDLGDLVKLMEKAEKDKAKKK